MDFTVSSPNDCRVSKSSKAMCYINVISEPMQAEIFGGYLRTVNADGETTLDASKSYDPNQPPDNQKLNFSWSCNIYNDVPQNFCKGKYVEISSGIKIGAFNALHLHQVVTLEYDLILYSKIIKIQTNNV